MNIPSDYTAHSAGPCPVHLDAIVDVFTRDNDRLSGAEDRAGSFTTDWQTGRIVAFKVTGNTQSR